MKPEDLSIGGIYKYTARVSGTEFVEYLGSYVTDEWELHEDADKWWMAGDNGWC